ncbi:MAG: hypothetical protein M1826_003244 [Phylliscum demangeonii]|nr:MAG: hypothetical protein M1826_003244 [Phylliscum demangeonii]
MAYTDDGVLAKLSALNETQESIVTVAQWVMFHRRHAERTVQLWFTRLKESTATKKLNLIYLANEVAQQSKVRRKHDFLVAFSPIITDATAAAYRGASSEVQNKLRRVVEVWRQRQIFELPIQEAIESRINEIDRSRSSGKKPLFGGSMTSGVSPPVPSELQPLVPLQTAVGKLDGSKASSVANAKQEYHEVTDPAASKPTPPVHAARLSGLLKTLASAEGAVAESIKARQTLIHGLGMLLEQNRAVLEKDESEQAELVRRKAEVETQKREVEDGIMRGLAADEPGHHAGASADANGDGVNVDGSTRDPHGAPLDYHTVMEMRSPAMEALSPPPMEELTPPHSPPRAAATEADDASPVTDAIPVAETPHAGLAEPHPTPLMPSRPSPFVGPASAVSSMAPAGSDLLSSLAMPPLSTRPAAAAAADVNGSNKKRKLDHDHDHDHDAHAGPHDEVAAALGDEGDEAALEGLDPEVVAILREQNSQYR